MFLQKILKIKKKTAACQMLEAVQELNEMDTESILQSIDDSKPTTSTEDAQQEEQ